MDDSNPLRRPDLKRILFVAALCARPGDCADAPTPPVAPQKPYTVKGPKERADPYYWLRDDTRKAPEVFGYLAYRECLCRRRARAAEKPLREKLYSEIVGRIKQDDASVPFRERSYYYTLPRRRGLSGACPQAGARFRLARILLDQPKLAKGHSFFSVSDWDVSRNNRLLAYAEDVIGRRQYVMRVKDLATGGMLAGKGLERRGEPGLGRRQPRSITSRRTR